MIFLHRVFILVMGNYVKIALCHNKSLWRVMLNNSVSLVVQGLHSICPWFSGSGSNQASNGFQHWLPAASNTIAKTLWAPSALTVLGLWSKQCNKRQDYKEHNDHKRPRETKLWQTRLFRSLWFLNHPDWLKRWGWRKDNPVFFIPSVAGVTFWLHFHFFFAAEGTQTSAELFTKHSILFKISHSQFVLSLGAKTPGWPKSCVSNDGSSANWRKSSELITGWWAVVFVFFTLLTLSRPHNNI